MEQKGDWTWPYATLESQFLSLLFPQNRERWPVWLASLWTLMGHAFAGEVAVHLSTPPWKRSTGLVCVWMELSAKIFFINGVVRWALRSQTGTKDVAVFSIKSPVNHQWVRKHCLQQGKKSTEPEGAEDQTFKKNPPAELVSIYRSLMREECGGSWIHFLKPINVIQFKVFVEGLIDPKSPSCLSRQWWWYRRKRKVPFGK